MSKTLSEIWQDVQDQYKIGVQQSLSQGSTVPLVETMQSNADYIKEMYGLDLNELLRLSKEDIDRIKIEQIKEEPIKQKTENDTIKPIIYIGVSALVLLIAFKVIKIKK